MEREELINSKEYNLANLQLDLFNKVAKYMRDNKLDKLQMAEKLGVSKIVLNSILNGEADLKLSKMIEIECILKNND